MKTLVVMLALVSGAFAKHKEQPYDHTGKLIYHPIVSHYILEGRDDLYYDDDYVCIPGDEHNAPTCRIITDWYAIDVPAYAEIILDDGRRIAVMMFPPRDSVHLEGNPSMLLCEEPGNAFCSLSHIWLAGEDNFDWIDALGVRPVGMGKGNHETTFRYRYRNGSKDIDYDWKSLPNKQ